MRTERKPNIAGLPYAKAISIHDRVRGGYQGRLVGRVPMRHEKCLGSKNVGMSASEDLGRRPVELVNSGFLGWKA